VHCECHCRGRGHRFARFLPSCVKQPRWSAAAGCRKAERFSRSADALLTLHSGTRFILVTRSLTMWIG